LVRKTVVSFRLLDDFYKRYICFAATTCDGKNENHPMFIIENTNADVFTGTLNISVYMKTTT